MSWRWWSSCLSWRWVRWHAEMYELVFWRWGCGGGVGYVEQKLYLRDDKPCRGRLASVSLWSFCAFVHGRVAK